MQKGAGKKNDPDSGPFVDQVRSALRARMKEQSGTHTVHRDFSGMPGKSSRLPKGDAPGSKG